MLTKEFNIIYCSGNMTTDQKTIEYLLNRIETLEKENKMWMNKFHEQNMKEIIVNVKEFPKQFEKGGIVNETVIKYKADI